MEKQQAFDNEPGPTLITLDTNTDRTQKLVHACMSQGFMPTAMHEKGRQGEEKLSCFSLEYNMQLSVT